MSIPDSRFSGPLPAVVDHIIVGAGSAGVVLAARLSADPGCVVLLLEAGDPVDQDVARVPGKAPSLWSRATAYDNLTIPQRGLGGRQIALITGRGLGGGSTVNGMGWFHGHPEDYDGWATSGATGWGWADVAPYLRSIEDHELGAGPFHGASGPMAITTPYHMDPLTARFIEAWAAPGWPVTRDLKGELREGVGLVQSNIRDGVRHSVLDGYLNPSLDRPNLTVRTGTPAQRIAIENTRAIGVHCEGGRSAPGGLSFFARGQCAPRTCCFCPESGPVRAPAALSRRFTDRPPCQVKNSADQRIWPGRRDSGFLVLPCLRGAGKSRGPRTGARKATDDPGRNGHADRPPLNFPAAGRTLRRVGVPSTRPATPQLMASNA